MFELAQDHSSLGMRLFRVLGLVTACAQFGLFIFCLPPFQYGLWYQSEPVLLAIFTFAVFSSLWLATGTARGWLLPVGAHPVWNILALGIVWQVLVTLWATSPWRSWFGPPEIGEGAGRFLAMWLLAMAAYPLWQVPSYRRKILLVALASLFVQCFLHAINPHGPEHHYGLGTFVPAKFASYLAFMAGCFWIAASASGFVQAPFRYGLLGLFTLLVLGISHNKSGIVLLSLALATSAIIPLLSKYSRFFDVTRTWRWLAVAACFLPMLWVAFCVQYGGAVGNNPEANYFERLLTKDDGVGSRVALNQVAISTMQHEPLRWLAGDGWGRFTDDIFKYPLVDGVYAYKDGKRQPNWTPLEGDAYHSHNQPLEVLLSLGLPGLLLWFAIPIALLLKLQPQHFWTCAPMLVGLVALSYFWFELPQSLAFDALLLVALASVAQGDTRAVRRKRWLLWAIVASVPAMLWSTWQQTQTIRFTNTLADAISELPYEDYTLGWLTSDIDRGGDALHNIIILYAAELQLQKAIDANQRGWYALLMNAASIAATAPNAGARLASTELWMQYKLLIDFGGFRSFEALGHQAAQSITESVLLVTKKAPLRDDYATFYLLNLAGITHNDKSKQEEILRKMLNLAPNHRPALWLLGKLLDNEEGHALMKRAAMLGVGTVYPVTNAEMKSILPDIGI